MSIKKNPFGVGQSGENMVERERRCDCCGWPYREVALSQQHMSPWCARCRDHFRVDGEDEVRELARLRDHEPRWRTYTEAARDAAMKLAGEVRERRTQTASALRTRDKWRAVVVEVGTLHDQAEGDPKRCACGVDWPCRTYEVLYLDPGLGREITTRAYRDLIEDSEMRGTWQ